MQKFNEGDRIRGLGMYENHDMWGDMEYIRLSDDGRIHLCKSNLMDRNVPGGFGDENIEPWDKAIGFEVGDEATYIFHGGRPYQSGKIVEVNDKSVYFEFYDNGDLNCVPFNFDGTGICRSTFPKDPNKLYGFKFPFPLTDGTDEGATLRLDKKAEKEDILTPEQVLAAELRTILTRADEIMKTLSDQGYDTHLTMLTEESFENDEDFTLMPIEIIREQTVFEHL